MIVNFYKMRYGNYRNSELMDSKNIECVPQIGMLVIYSGRTFMVDRVCFNPENSYYDVYLAKV